MPIINDPYFTIDGERYKVTHDPVPPAPVDCVLSAWSPWSEWTACVNGQQTRTRTRTVVTPPSGGGAACGPLTETETQACTVPPPATGNVVLVGSAKVSQQFRIGPADRAPLSVLQAAVAATPKWDLWDTPDEQISASRNGVRVTSTVKLHVWGQMNGLYKQIPMLKADGTMAQAYPADDVTGHTADFAAAVARLAVYGAHGGERGASLCSGWVSSRGHSRRKADGTLSVSPHIPQWISVQMDGWIIYEFRDGRVEFAFKIPGAQATPDFTFFRPNRKLFFVCDALAKCIYKIDRTAGEDPATWIVTTLATGFVKPVGIREVGGQLYVADNGANKIIRVDPATGAKTDLMSLANVFWIASRSDGKMWVATLTAGLYIIDPANPVSGTNLSTVSGLRTWVYVSGDEAGTWGPADECTMVAMGGTGNTDVWRYQGGQFLAAPWPKPVVNPPYHFGSANVGNTQFCNDVVGHYVWVCEHHPDEALIRVQGVSDVFPSLLAQKPDNYPAEDVYDNDAFGKGRIILENGTVPGVIYGTKPSFTCQIANTAMSLLGAGADYLALKSYADLEAWLLAGGFGSFPRPEIKGRDLYRVGYFIYRSSIRFLKEGNALMAGWLAYCTPKFGQELPPVTQPPSNAETDTQMDVEVSGTNLVVKFRDKYGNPKVPEAGLVVRLYVDEQLPEQIDLGTLASPWTIAKPTLTVGQHALRALPVSGVPVLTKYKGRATVLVS